MPAFGKNNGNDELNGFGSDGVEYAKKSEKSKKLSKSRKSKSEKLAKSKKLSKSKNLPKFYAKKAEISFLTPDARIAFNYLQLAFTKAPIC